MEKRILFDVAYRSILKGNMPLEIPNLRDKAVREQWRSDTACTDPKTAGDMLLPTFSRGTPDIDDSVYARMKELWQAEREGRRPSVINAILTRGGN